MMVTERCPNCRESVYWLVDSRSWRHYGSRNLECDTLPAVVASDLLTQVNAVDSRVTLPELLTPAHN